MQYLPKITQADLGKINRAKILNVLREQEVTSKQELAKALRFSHTTINTHIQSLIDDGLVELAGEGESIGGRKPLMLRIAKQARYSFGVYIAPERAIILLGNLRGEIELKQTITYHPGTSFEHILEQVADAISAMLTAKRLPREKLVGVGVSVPGSVDIEKNVIVFAPNIGVRNYSMQAFSEKVGMPVFAENEAITATFAEQLIGRGKTINNFVYISIAKGIGSGIVLGGARVSQRQHERR